MTLSSHVKIKPNVIVSFDCQGKNHIVVHCYLLFLCHNHLLNYSSIMELLVPTTLASLTPLTENQTPIGLFDLLV